MSRWELRQKNGRKRRAKIFVYNVSLPITIVLSCQLDFYSFDYLPTAFKSYYFIAFFPSAFHSQKCNFQQILGSSHFPLPIQLSFKTYKYNDTFFKNELISVSWLPKPYPQSQFNTQKRLKSRNKNGKIKVPPRFELGLQDSESWVLTITPWDHASSPNFEYILLRLLSISIYFVIFSFAMKAEPIHDTWICVTYSISSRKEGHDLLCRCFYLSGLYFYQHW